MDQKKDRIMRWFVVLLGVSLVGAVPTVYGAKAYKWVDKYGNVTYQDSPPPDSATYIEEKEIQSQKAVRSTGVSIQEVAAKSPVTLYLIPDCASCDAARAYLKKRKIPFKEKNVENNPELQVEMKKRIGVLTVPAILIGKKIMKGYIQSLLEGELDAVGYPKVGAVETPETPTEPPEPSPESTTTPGY